jgi:hypothetical protein
MAKTMKFKLGCRFCLTCLYGNTEGRVLEWMRTHVRNRHSATGFGPTDNKAEMYPYSEWTEQPRLIGYWKLETTSKH